MMERDILLVGTGNVAHHLAKALAPRVAAVVSRNPLHARQLAVSVGIPRHGTFADAPACPIVIISLADNAIGEVVQALGPLPGTPLVLHTSGTIPKEALTPLSPRVGVLYPLQTFSKNTGVDMSAVPFFTEAESESDLAIIDALARSISPTVHHAGPEQRRKLHVAGVFTSNFTTALLHITRDVLAAEGYPLATVRPLIEATVAKVFAVGPECAMTGPARRGDKAVIDLQSASLPPAERRIYDAITDYIIKKHDVELR